MKFKTLFKKFNSKKHDKKQPPSSPKTTTPPSINTQVIDCPLIQEQDSVIFSNFDEYNTNANTSNSSLSYSLPTSFPPSLPNTIQPMKQKNTRQPSAFNEESINNLQITTKSSIPLKDPSYSQSRNNDQENITKDETIKSKNIDSSNDIINDKTSSKISNIQTVSGINSNDDTVIPLPTPTPSPSHKSPNYDSLRNNQEIIAKNETIKSKNIDSSNDKTSSKISNIQTDSYVNSNDDTVIPLPTPTPSPSPSHKSLNYDSLKSNKENDTKNETIKNKIIESSNDIINNKSSSKIPNTQTFPKMHTKFSNNSVISHPVNTNINSIASPEVYKTSSHKTLTSHKDNVSKREGDNIIHSLNPTKVPDLKVKQLEKEIGNLKIHNNNNNRNHGNALHSNNNNNNNNTNKNKLALNVPQENLGTIVFDNYSRQKLYDSPNSPVNLALTSQFSSSPVSPSKKKSHNIFSYLLKKDKKKNKELKTVYQHFSVMDTQSIEHDGLVMVEKQDNVIHDLWEQRNSDLNKINNELHKSTSDRNLNQNKVQPSIQFSTLPRMSSERDRINPPNSPCSDSHMVLSITRPPRSPKYSLNCPERRRSYVNPEDYPMAYSPKSLNNPYCSLPRKNNNNKNYISRTNSINSDFTDISRNSNSNLNSSSINNNRVSLCLSERYYPLNHPNIFTNYNTQSPNNTNKEINSIGIPVANVNSPMYINPIAKSPTSTSNSPIYTNPVVKSSLLTSNLQQFSPPKFVIRNESLKPNLHIDSDISTSSPKLVRKVNYHSPVSYKQPTQEFLTSPLSKSDSSSLSPKEARKSPSITSSKISPIISPKSYISNNDDDIKEIMINNDLSKQNKEKEKVLLSEKETDSNDEIKTEEKNKDEIDESSHLPVQDGSKSNLNVTSQSSSSSSDSESLENSTKQSVKSGIEDTKDETTKISIKNQANNIIEEPIKPSTQSPNEEPIKPSTQSPNEEPIKPSTQNPNEEPIKPSTQSPNEEPIKTSFKNLKPSISKASSISSRSNSFNTDDELSDTNDSFDSSVGSTSNILNEINSLVDEDEKTSQKESQEEEIIEEPLSQEEAIKYNILNMKPIKIVQESKPIKKDNININKPVHIRQMSTGILKNKGSNSILKNKSSYGIIKNKNVNPFIFEEIAAFPIKFDQNPSNQLKNKLSIESKKSKVSFCESKNEYRDIAINKKSSSNLNVNIKRISTSSSIAPYIVEKSLNQTTILSDSSVKFDNYNTTESFSILKGNFNDESIDPNIEYLNSEIIKLDSPLETNFDHEIPSISSINISYDTEMNEEQNNINTFEKHHLINNETESSATFYHNGKTNSFEEVINKRSSSPILHNNNDNVNNNDDNDEIINFFEQHSDNKTSSFIVFDKDDCSSKEDSLFEKEIIQDNSTKTVVKSNFSKLRNVIESSDNTKNSDIYESEYTQSYPSSSTTNNINSNYTLYFNNFYI